MIQDIEYDSTKNPINKQVSLIVGLDLSFNSTGITFAVVEDSVGNNIEFHRLVYQIKPNPIININQHTYNLPTNVNVDDIVDDTDFYSEDQAFITIKAMMSSKRILLLIIDKLNRIAKKYINYDINVYVNIEGFIMPNLAGNQQLRVLGGLIMLQGLVRSELIKLKITHINDYKFNEFKIFITSPTELKSYFTGNGSASSDKQLMLDSFLMFYDGAKLLPDTTSLAKVNDIIDSFALMMNCYNRVFLPNEFHLWKTRKAATAKQKKALAKNKARKKKEPQIIIHL